MKNLLAAWREFSRGKRHKREVMEFEFRLEDNLFRMQEELQSKTYRHGTYDTFYVRDPKLRCINKACVKDRVLHQAVFRILYQIFDPTFIHDSYSCRVNKGTHAAVSRLEEFARKISTNNTRTFFALKCDIRKFFDSIDQDVLLRLICDKVADSEALGLIREIVTSFPRGLPLGNVTSQLFANIYLYALDHFAKHDLKARFYIRYCDDFVILGKTEEELRALVPRISKFLESHLKLSLHPDKVTIRKASQGIDLLGYVVLPHHRVLRTKTKRRVFRKIKDKQTDLSAGIIDAESFNQTLQSYFGVLKHCAGFKVKQNLLESLREDSSQARNDKQR